MDGLPWALQRDMYGGLHATPEADTYDHPLMLECWCHPVLDITDDGHAVVMHNSADGREAFERGERKFS